MILRTVVIDDEAPARRRLKKLVDQAAELKLVGEAESGRQAIEVIIESKPDLILLDIQLKDLTAFEVLNQLGDEHFAVIFITAYDKYAIQAFEQNAIDYLLKPYKDDRFSEAIERAINRIQKSHQQPISELIKGLSHFASPQKIRIPEGKTIHLLDPTKVLYIKADTYYCNIQFEDQSQKMIRISLKGLEELLPDHFKRISRSVIINKDQITSFKKLKKTVEVVIGDHTFSMNQNVIDFEL